MKRIQQGFTLIELMIVVAIIGILAAIAIPAYQDYLTRAQVTEAIELLGGFKTPIAEFYGDKGHYPTNIGAKNSGQSIEGTVSGKYSGQVTIASGGGQTAGAGDFVITATMSTGQAATMVLALGTADGGAKWGCAKDGVNAGAAAASAAFPDKYLPAACKL